MNAPVFGRIKHTQQCKKKTKLAWHFPVFHHLQTSSQAYITVKLCLKMSQLTKSNILQ